MLRFKETDGFFKSAFTHLLNQVNTFFSFVQRFYYHPALKLKAGNPLVIYPERCIFNSGRSIPSLQIVGFSADYFGQEEVECHRSELFRWPCSSV